jgi:DNA/RNA-binding domain of Phe-tRNA-synthetase-like protein
MSSATTSAVHLAPIFEGFAEANTEQVTDTRRIMLSLKQIGADKAVQELETLIDSFNKDARRYRASAEALRKSLTP